MIRNILGDMFCKRYLKKHLKKKKEECFYDSMHFALREMPTLGPDKYGMKRDDLVKLDEKDNHELEDPLTLLSQSTAFFPDSDLHKNDSWRCLSKKEYNSEGKDKIHYVLNNVQLPFYASVKIDTHEVKLDMLTDATYNLILFKRTYFYVPGSYIPDLTGKTDHTVSIRGVSSGAVEVVITMSLTSLATKFEHISI
jgi:hypothetical protein